MGTGVGNGRDSLSPSLKPGDEVVGLTAEEAFSMVASARNVRGIDSQWNIVDSDAFVASLEQAGLDPARGSAGYSGRHAAKARWSTGARRAVVKYGYSWQGNWRLGKARVIRRTAVQAGLGYSSYRGWP